VDPSGRGLRIARAPCSSRLPSWMRASDTALTFCVPNRPLQLIDALAYVHYRKPSGLNHGKHNDCGHRLCFSRHGNAKEVAVGGSAGEGVDRRIGPGRDSPFDNLRARQTGRFRCRFEPRNGERREDRSTPQRNDNRLVPGQATTRAGVSQETQADRLSVGGPGYAAEARANGHWRPTSKRIRHPAVACVSLVCGREDDQPLPSGETLSTSRIGSDNTFCLPVPSWFIR
jgi:hypothetical protein